MTVNYKINITLFRTHKSVTEEAKLYLNQSLINNKPLSIIKYSLTT